MARTSFLIEECAWAVDPLELHALAPERYPVLLQSAAHGAQTGRWDILMAGPGERISGDDGFLARLDAAWSEAGGRRRASPPEHDRDAPPFSGGWFIYLDYELAAEIEPRLVLPPRHALRAQAVRMHGALIRDHRERRAWLCAEAGADALLRDLRRDHARAAARADAAYDDALPALTLDEAPADEYRRGVRTALEHIGAGDVFQVNLSRAWRGRFASPPDAVRLYRRLRDRNPGPFAGLARVDGGTIVSSSPERLLSVSGAEVQTRPIAGTRPRGADAAGDRRHRRALRASPKERAEHVMLIDLERNDLGRICAGGSVRVDEFMVMEAYAHVHHIVSNVRGTLRDDVSPGDTIAALFPGGTITGCPKVRCMEIIAALENEARGPYTGSMGWLGHDGRMDLNILIRTLVLQGDAVSLRAGAGIVADSDPDRELAETRSKARGLLLALGEEAADVVD